MNSRASDFIYGFVLIIVHLQSYKCFDASKNVQEFKEKKKARFFGKKAWEVRGEELNSAEESSQVESSVTVRRHFDGSNSYNSSANINKETSLQSKGHNISAEKIQKSSILTRNSTRKLGLTNVDIAEAHGYKLQDSTLLSNCISAAAICSSCRSPNSKLKLYQDTKKRDGLKENLFLLCSECKNETTLNTSRRIGGVGGGAYDVNRRSVLASHQWGLAGLTKFCASLDLPPPVTKKAYNDHLISIEKQAKNNAEKLMCDAAKRLKDITEKEHPEDIHTLQNGHAVADVSVSVDGTWQKGDTHPRWVLCL